MRKLCVVVYRFVDKVLTKALTRLSVFIRIAVILSKGPQATWTRKLQLSFLLLLSFWVVSAQTLQRPVRQFDIEDGLPSSTVYKVIEDFEGNIWLATENGISRYDGYEFKNLSSTDGLIDDDVIDISIDESGTKWYTTATWKHGFLKADTMGGLELPNEFDDYQQSYVVRTHLGDYLVGTWNNGMLHLKEDTIIRYNSTNGVAMDMALPYDKRGTEVLIAGAGRTWGTFQDSSIIWNALPDSVRHPKNENCGKLNPIYFNDSVIIISDYCTIYSYSGGNYKKLHSAPGRIHFINVSDDEMLLIATSAGAYRLNIAEKDPQPEYWLKDISVSQFFQDRQGNFWITTLEKGLFNVPVTSVSVKNAAPDEGTVSAIGKAGNQLLLGTTKSQLYQLNASGLQKIFDLKDNKGVISQIMEGPSGNIWLMTDMGLFKVSTADIFNNEYFQKISWNPGEGEVNFLDGEEEMVPDSVNNIFITAVKDLILTEDSSLITGSRTGLIRIWETAPSTLSVQLLLKHQISAIAEYGKQGILIGHFDGLFLYDWNLRSDISEIAPILNEKVTAIEVDAYGVAWIATSSNGIYAYKDEVLFHLKEEGGLLSNNCYDLLINQDTIWVGTLLGVSRLVVRRGDKYNTQSIRQLTSSDGLIPGAIEKLFRHNDVLYASNTGGVSRVPLNIRFPGPFTLQITDATLKDGTSVINSDVSQINFSNNDINLRFKGIQPVCNGTITYHYYLEGLSVSWDITNDLSASFNNLPAGQYNFKVYAVDCHGVRSDSTKSFRFTISPPWWQQAQYQVILGLLLIGSIMIVVLYIRNYYKHKSDLQAMISDLENQALRAQMNPHFIFNALNAVNEFITTNNKAEANIYLSTFSSLIRKTLQNSTKKEISLDEELESLRLYIDLEQMRFNNSFSYEIKVDPSIEQENTFVPPLLLQPFAENAIRHGLIHKVKDGFLKIRVSEVEANLVFEVEDNGVGISSKDNKEHQSLGIELSRQRLENFASKQTTKEIGIQVINKNDVDDRGVLVKLTLPHFKD